MDCQGFTGNCGIISVCANALIEANYSQHFPLMLNITPILPFSTCVNHNACVKSEASVGSIGVFHPKGGVYAAPENSELGRSASAIADPI
jgi:hypothetical protein